MNVPPVHIDDPFHAAHQKPLGGGVVFGNDHKTVFDIRQGPLTGGHAQVDNRDRAPADTRHAAYHRTALGQGIEFRALQDFTHLEHIDAVDLITVQAEQQQFQPILPHQLSPLVDTVEYARHCFLLNLPLRPRSLSTGMDVATNPAKRLRRQPIDQRVVGRPEVCRGRYVIHTQA